MKRDNLWLLTNILFFGAVVENILSHVVTLRWLSLGGTELNPFARFFVSSSGVVFVLVALSVYFFLYGVFILARRYGDALPAVLSLFLFVGFSFDFIHDLVVAGGVL